MQTSKRFAYREYADEATIDEQSRPEPSYQHCNSYADLKSKRLLKELDSNPYDVRTGLLPIHLLFLHH